jgi:hypothetical protein
MRFQERRVSIFFTFDVEMSKRWANAVWVTLPFAYSLRIRGTCLEVARARLESSPDAHRRGTDAKFGSLCSKTEDSSASPIVCGQSTHAPCDPGLANGNHRSCDRPTPWAKSGRID